MSETTNKSKKPATIQELRNQPNPPGHYIFLFGLGLDFGSLQCYYRPHSITCKEKIIIIGLSFLLRDDNNIIVLDGVSTAKVLAQIPQARPHFIHFDLFDFTHRAFKKVK